MYENWAEIRTQMEQVLEHERAHRHVRRVGSNSLWQTFRQWWSATHPRFWQRQVRSQLS